MGRTSEYRRFQDWRHKKRMESLLESCPSVVYWNDYNNKRYLKIYYYGNPFYKRHSIRKVRRLNTECSLPKGNISHKYYDYWWSIT